MLLFIYNNIQKFLDEDWCEEKLKGIVGDVIWNWCIVDE